MSVEWEKKLACAATCSRCDKSLNSKDQRILSVYNNEPICMTCKGKEEQRPDYKATSIAMVKHCLVDVELMPTGDPGAYCFHHFYPFTCQ
jgi:hypothetical protein